MSSTPVSPVTKRGPWSQQEDRMLLDLVNLHGAQNWVKISQLLGSRSPKQCRERYHQNLKPTLNHAPITPEEGELIESLVHEMGKRWADIARRLEGRSDNAVKNWWNGGMNRRRRIVARGPGGGDHQFNENGQPLAFARPAHTHVAHPHQSIIIPVSQHRMIEPPLTSPVHPEVSMPNSDHRFNGNSQPLAFARPAHARVAHSHRSMMIPVSQQRRIEPPLTSPVHSEVSMADSVGEAPSLISDSGSHPSMSSPSVQRPPGGLPLPDPLQLQAHSADSWRSAQTFNPQLPMPFTSDRSPSLWGPRDISKAQYTPTHQNQRLEHLSEVATRSDLQQQSQTLPHRQGLPSVNRIANHTIYNSMHRSPSILRTRDFVPLEPQLAGVGSTDLAQHSLSSPRPMAAPTETPQPSSTVKRKADDTDPTTPPDRKRLAVSFIID